jgi:3-(3-hydroxy-phenyl)propionate hydroxylase
VIGLEQRNDHVNADDRDAGRAVSAAAQYVVACDGARSSLRQMVGAEFAGQVFEDQFLIADVKMTAEFPTERWFWFDPPFHAGRSALLHKQPDDIWRIDLQLSPDADPWSKSGRKMCGRGSRACSATTSSISNGSRCTNSSAGGWINSSMAA